MGLGILEDRVMDHVPGTSDLKSGVDGDANAPGTQAPPGITMILNARSTPRTGEQL